MPSKRPMKTDQLHILKIVSYSAFVLAVLALISSLVILYTLAPMVFKSSNQSSSTSQQSNTGHTGTLAGIDNPLNSSSLSIINNAPNAYFEKAGEMYLNGTLSDPVFLSSTKITPFNLNDGKATVLYFGSITCVFCGENRWAMALALSRFGNFSQLFIGYSSLGDGDLPTLYWNKVNYNGSSDSLGNYYSSSALNFMSIEDTHPITGGFALNSMPQIKANINAQNSTAYSAAFDYILNLSNNKTTVFQGTPYTIWGNYLFSGADAEVFGNTTPSGSTLPLTYMTHGQVFAQLANPSDQFAYGEYAAADVYVAAICKSINNTASVCSLPAINALEASYK